MPGLAEAFWLVLDPYVILVLLLASVFGLVVGACRADRDHGDRAPGAAHLLHGAGAGDRRDHRRERDGDLRRRHLGHPAAHPGHARLRLRRGRLPDDRQGQAELALGVCLVTSAIGGLFGAAVLAFSAPCLPVRAQVQLGGVFLAGLLRAQLRAVFISTDAPVKGVVSLLIGLFIATIGIDITAGYRFSFGNVELMGGVSFIPAMIGMFAIGEILRYVTVTTRPVEIHAGDRAHLPRPRPGALALQDQPDAGNLIGVVVGVLPGAGADIAAWISYAVAKRFSKEPEKFGTGHVEGLVDAGAANNSALGGAWVPALVFGIPGDSITAIVIGVLYMKNMNPGRPSCCTRRSCSTPCSSRSSSPTF